MAAVKLKPMKRIYTPVTCYTVIFGLIIIHEATPSTVNSKTLVIAKLGFHDIVCLSMPDNHSTYSVPKHPEHITLVLTLHLLNANNDCTKYFKLYKGSVGLLLHL